MPRKRRELASDNSHLEHGLQKKLRSAEDEDMENEYDIINLDSEKQYADESSSDADKDSDFEGGDFESGFGNGIGSKIVTFSDASDGEEADLEELVFGSKIKKPEAAEDGPIGFFIDKTTGGAIEKSGAVWTDDDDDEEVGAEAEDIEQRGIGNMRIKPLLKANRKTEFEKSVGEPPSWSVIPDVEPETDETNELLTSSFKYTTRSDRLPRSPLDFHQCTDLNKQQPTQGPLEVCEFHKSAQIGMTGGRDCRLNLFQVDGKQNSKIHSFFLERFPIRCAHFLASGEEIVVTSRPRYFYSYDLISGQITETRCIKGTDDQGLRKFYVSPDEKHLLFSSTHGYIHLVSAKTKELIKTVKVNGRVNDIVFRKQGQEFLAFGEEGVVTIWDIRSQSCFHSFVDEGCTSGTSLTASPNGQYVACGSRSGVVNLYDEICFANEEPAPVKIFKNLQYATNCLQFNSSSEILCMSSEEADNAIRLIHVPSKTVFSNFPGLTLNYLKFIKNIDFSPNSGYMVIGNHKGKGLLFRLDHYKSY